MRIPLPQFDSCEDSHLTVTMRALAYTSTLRALACTSTSPHGRCQVAAGNLSGPDPSIAH